MEINIKEETDKLKREMRKPTDKSGIGYSDNMPEQKPTIESLYNEK